MLLAAIFTLRRHLDSSEAAAQGEYRRQQHSREQRAEQQKPDGIASPIRKIIVLRQSDQQVVGLSFNLSDCRQAAPAVHRRSIVELGERGSGSDDLQER